MNPYWLAPGLDKAIILIIIESVRDMQNESNTVLSNTYMCICFAKMAEGVINNSEIQDACSYWLFVGLYVLHIHPCYAAWVEHLRLNNSTG